MMMTVKVNYSTIESAVGGDKEAIDAILKFYSGYIASICSDKVCDTRGIYYCINEEMESLIKSKLVEKILKFRID